MTAGPEAGWYDDGQGKQRWWDGTRWTEQYIDLRERDVALHVGAAVGTGAAVAGWYDDGRGRRRWWDGSRWTDAAQFSGDEESFAGIVVDGRWIHLSNASEPIAGSVASIETATDMLRRRPLAKLAGAGALYGAWGVIAPRQISSAIRSGASYLVVDVAGQVWLAEVAVGQDDPARRFATWINSVSQHYLYR